MLQKYKRINSMPAVRLRNLVALIGYVIIMLVLSISYFIESKNGSISHQHFITSIILLTIIFIIAVISYFLFKDNNINIFAYILGLSYMTFYIYITIASTTLMTFVYIFPMLFLLISYDDSKLVAIITSAATAITVIGIMFNASTILTYSSKEKEIAIACMFLTVLFCQLGRLPIIQAYNNLEHMEDELLLDTLTKCHNRYFLDKLIESGFFEDKRVKVILGDINDFKKINDTYGHTNGDLALIRVGNALKNICNKYDDTWEIRIGGDEFVIVTKLPDARSLMKECFKTCKDDEYINNLGFEVKISFGHAANPTGKKHYQDLYEEADRVMYERKQAIKKQEREQLFTEETQPYVKK